MSTYQLDIDGSGAEAGAQRIVRSFDQIKAAADRMEGGVTAAAKKASAAFGDLQRNARPVSAQAIDSIRQLSNVFKGFKAPSDAAVRNTIMFLQGLKSVGTLNLGRVSGLASLLSAISGYRGPSATAGKNTQSLLSSLSKITGFSVGRGLSGTLAALSGFRGPSAAAARNVQSLLNALATFRAPAGLATAARALDALAAAAARARSSLGALKSVSVGATNINMNTKAASAGMGQLITQHGLLQRTILKTSTMYNALGGILAARTFITASNDIIKIQAQLEAATGSAAQARVQFAFLREQTEKLGLEFTTTARSYGFFLGAIKGTGVTFSEASDIFRGFTTAARALQLSVSDVDGIFRALGQIMSKGKLQAEELRGQLGDRLPGAFVRFAVALKMTKPGELDKALKDGAVSGDKLKKAIIEVASTMENEFAGSAEKMSKTVDASFNRLKNAFTFAAADAGTNGLNAAIISITDALTKFIQSDGVGNFLKVIAKLFQVLGNNIEIVAYALEVLALNALLKWVVGLQGLARTLTVAQIGITYLTTSTASLAAAQAAGGATAVAMARGLGSVGVAATGATGAFVALRTILISHPIIFLAAAVLAAAVAIQKLTEESNKETDALDQLNEKMADAENYSQAIIQKQLDLAKATGDTTNKIVQQIQAFNDLALAGAKENMPGYSAAYGSADLKRLQPKSAAGGMTREQLAFFDTVATRSGTGYSLKSPPGGLTSPTEAGFRMLSQAQAETRVRVENGKQAVFEPLLKRLDGLIDALISSSRLPGNKGLDYEALARKYGGDYNQDRVAGAALSGDPVTGAAKARTQPQAYAAFKRELEKEGFSFTPNQGFRTHARQAAIKAKYSRPGEAASAGTSSHEFYKALDLPAGASDAKVRAAAARAGVTLKDPLIHGRAGNVHRHQEFLNETGGNVGEGEEEILKAQQQWAEELERNLHSAGKAFSDLKTEAVAAGSVVDQLLNGSLDSAGAAAKAAAVGQLKTFEDTFDSAQKAEEGVKALAASLQATGNIDPSINTSSLEEARMAILGVYEAQQAETASMIRGAEVAKQVSDMREANNIEEEAQKLLALGKTQAEVNKFLEIENALIGVNGANRDKILKGLDAEIQRREKLAHTMEILNNQRELEKQKNINSAMSGVYASGASSEDVDYYKEMFAYREDMIQKGASGDVLRGLIASKEALLNEARAAKLVADEYEKTKQAAVDMADAIVGGFKEGMENGQSFLKTIKDIFGQLKDIILDLVLYNPLKQFLASVFTQGLSPGAAAAGTAGATTSGSAGSVLGTIFGGGGGGGASSSTLTGSARQATQNIGESIATATERYQAAGVSSDGSIVINGQRVKVAPDLNAPIGAPQAQTKFFDGLSKMFDFKANGTAFKNLAGALKSGKGIGAAIGPAAAAAGQAFAAYQMGNQIGKAVGESLGFGKRGSNVAGGVLGGAAAGFSLGGPIGAAIGAVAGGILGFLKKVPKTPSSYGNVTVGADGYAIGDAGHRVGKGSEDAGKQMGSAAAKMFNDFALQFGAKLTPGNYGSFGSTAFKNDGIIGPRSFYSTLGVSSKGQPVGTEGVDWIKGTDSQVQAFALISQVRKGVILGLSDTIKTVFANTKATDMEGLQGDLEVGKAFDEFVRGSFKLSDMARQVYDLNTAYVRLAAQAKALGLSEDKLKAARGRMLKQMKDEFNFSIRQGILGIEDPAQGAYEALVMEYKEAVQTAMAVGGDLAQVEKYYGMKRAELAKQWADVAANGLISTAREIINNLTASQSSPLNQGTIFNNSRDLYAGLIREIQAGNYTNVDKLATYSQNYLDAARGMFGSSSGYFDIFTAVMDTLKQFEGLAGSTTDGGVGAGPPALPKLDAIVAEINKQSLEMIAATGAVGAAVVDGSSSIVAAINNLAIALGAGPIMSPGTSPTTPTPTAPLPRPGSGSVTGTVGSGGGSSSSGWIRIGSGSMSYQ